MKMELKYLVNYLPYNLDIEILNYQCDYVGIRYSVITGIYHVGIMPHFTYEGGSTGKSFDEFKPLLLPLSALTEPEYEKVFDEFSEMEHGDLLDRIDYVKMGLQTSENICNNLRFETINALFVNHFDVYGLLDANLAIDKRTIK